MAPSLAPRLETCSREKEVVPVRHIGFRFGHYGKLGRLDTLEEFNHYKMLFFKAKRTSLLTLPSHKIVQWLSHH